MAVELSPRQRKLVLAGEERVQLNRRLHGDLLVLFERVDFMRNASYHSTGYGRPTFFDTPVWISAPASPKTVAGLVNLFRS